MRLNLVGFLEHLGDNFKMSSMDTLTFSFVDHCHTCLVAISRNTCIANCLFFFSLSIMTTMFTKANVRMGFPVWLVNIVYHKAAKETDISLQSL